jgi:sugar phosphate isomerase/epimerase
VQLGLFTACLPWLTLDEVAGWAALAGYDALEVAAWPSGGDQPHQATHLEVDGPPIDTARIQALLAEHRLTLSAVSCYENNLIGDSAERQRTHRHLKACIRAASALGVPLVGTFVGRDPAKTVSANLREAEKLLPELVRYADDHGVRLVIENCPMEGWHPDGYPGNLAYSPELWDWLFDLGLYLNFDPSHLVWLGIDPVDALRSSLEMGRVLHVQAKDIEVDSRCLMRYSIFGKAVSRTSPEDTGWWRYRIPGRGQLDWNRIIDTLYTGGFDGTVAVEHEDPVWGGTHTKIKQGLEIAAQTLRPLIR